MTIKDKIELMCRFIQAHGFNPAVLAVEPDGKIVSWPDGCPQLPDGWDTQEGLIAIEAANATADLASNGTRYALQNQYLALCDQLTGGTNHVKLGFAELQAIIENLMASDPNTAVAFSLQLLTLNAALVREGGINWWDNCEWRVLP